MTNDNYNFADLSVRQRQTVIAEMANNFLCEKEESFKQGVDNNRQRFTEIDESNKFDKRHEKQKARNDLMIENTIKTLESGLTGVRKETGLKALIQQHSCTWQRAIDNNLISFLFSIPHDNPITTLERSQGFAWSFNGDIKHVLRDRENVGDIPHGLMAKVLILYCRHWLLSKKFDHDYRDKYKPYSVIELGSNLDYFLESIGFTGCTNNRNTLRRVIKQLQGCYFETINKKRPYIAAPLERWKSAMFTDSNLSDVAWTFYDDCLELFGEWRTDSIIKDFKKVDGKHVIILESGIERFLIPSDFTLQDGMTYEETPRYDMAIVSKLNKSPYALDVYILACYFLDRLKKGESDSLTWSELYALNGHGVADEKNYRKRFKDGLDEVKRALPQASGITTDKDGVIFKYRKYNPPVFP